MSPTDDNEALQIGPDPDKLFVYHRQQLSAMLDGELSPDQAKFMLRRLQHDAELAACWERWQVCGDMLRGQRNDLLPGDFARRVALALAADAPAAAATAPDERRARLRVARWGGAAIAASVALLAVFAGRQLLEPGALPEVTSPAPLVAGAPAANVPAAVPQVAAQAPVADATATVAPAPAVPPRDVSAALAATAVAAADVPRRASERRARTQPQRSDSRLRAAAETSALVASAVANAVPPAIALPETIATGRDHFAMPQPAAPRPWPRSLLPSPGVHAVADGRLAPREPGFEPFFQPAGRDLSWQLPTVAEPARPDATAQP